MLSSLDQLAFVALGSNLPTDYGSPAATVIAAMSRLRSLQQHPGERELLLSSLWQSKPVNCPPGTPWFVNAVVGLVPDPALSASQFLECLLHLEIEFGRPSQHETNSPRSLDLDLIDFRGQQLTSPELTLPHPEAVNRSFVMLPLNEIAPTLVLPGHQETVAQIAKKLANSEQELFKIVPSAEISLY